MEFAFKVQLSNVRAKQLNCSTRTPDAFPLFRLNFDEKIVESELYQGAGDPEWQSKANFEYRLREADLQEAATSLSLRTAVLEVCFVDMRGGRETKVGSCAVDLLSLCSGPNQLTYTLQNEQGAPSGNVFFSIVMEQQTNVAVDFRQIEVSGMPRATSYRLAYHFASVVGRDVESSAAQPSANPQWIANDLPRLEIRSTLRALLSSTIRVHVEDMQQRGTRVLYFDLPVKELIQSNASQTVPFKKNAYGTTTTSGQPNFAALATGSIQFSNLPVFAQFEKGENQQGSIYGKPLLPCLPLPPSYNKVPKRLPDMKPGQSQFEVAQNAALQPSLTGPSINSWGAQPAPPLTHYPAPPPPPQLQVSYQANYSAYPQQQQQQIQQYALPPLPPPQPVTQYNPSYNTSGPDSTMFSFSAAPKAPPPQFTSPVLHRPVPPQTNLTALGGKSPLALAGDNLIRQHHETVSAVDQQQRRVQALAQELHERTVAEVALTERKMKDLDTEEGRVREDLRRVDRAIDELRQMKDEQEVSFSIFIKKSEAERTALTNELEELHILYNNVTQLAKQISEHNQEDERIRERARLELEAARSRFHMDTKDLGEVEAKIQYRLVQPAPPSFAASNMQSSYVTTPVSNMSTNFPRPASPSRYRAVSPPRPLHTQLHSVAPSLEVSRDNNSLQAPSRIDFSNGASSLVAPPMHSDVEEIVSSVQANDNYRLQHIIKKSPRAIFDNNNLLHIACSQSAPDLDVVSTVLYYRPELVNGVDTATGATATHLACAAQVISLPVVDLLLSKGANLSVLDKDGLNPFHIALRNPSDGSHALKKLLLFKGSADINAPTGRGESPAHLMCIHDRYIDILRFLAKYGGNMNALARLPNADNVLTPVSPAEKARWYGPVAEECRRFLERGGL